MSIDRRLLHAARELREVPIEVPTLLGGAPPKRHRRIHAVAAPVLFVVGGLVAITGVTTSDPHVESDIVDTAAVADADAPLGAAVVGSPTARSQSASPIGGEIVVPSTTATPPSATPPSVRAELAMIAANASARPAAGAAVADHDSDSAPTRSDTLDGPL